MHAMYDRPSLRQMLKRARPDALDSAMLRMKLKIPRWTRETHLRAMWKTRERWFHAYLIEHGMNKDEAREYSEIEARYRQYLAGIYGDERVADSRLDLWVKDNGSLGWAIGALTLAT